MDYNYIEKLVRLFKAGDEYSKEDLVKEFKPFIINISKKTFTNGYEFEDIMNECYKILFKCISLYRTETHRFVDYATNGINNNINDLIRKNIKNNGIKSYCDIPFDSFLESTYQDNLPEIKQMLYKKYDSECLKYALSRLTSDEADLLTHLFYKNNTLKFYAEEKALSYSSAVKMKRYILDQLFMYVNIYINPRCSEKLSSYKSTSFFL